jgi:hypothetical protein
MADFQVSTLELSGFDEGTYRVWSKAGMEAALKLALLINTLLL